MNTNPNRYKAIDKIVKLNYYERLELIGYLLAKYPIITEGIIDFTPHNNR